VRKDYTRFLPYCSGLGATLILECQNTYVAPERLYGVQGWQKQGIPEEVSMLYPKCPACKNEFVAVTYPANSMLNIFQWRSIRSGDYFCKTCTRYFWVRDLAVPSP